MRDVLVVRHGESAWNAAGRWQGWLDVPLTDAGEEQARARGAQLADDGVAPAAIYCSDLSRAQRTAELIAAALGGGEPIPDPGFRERHGGVFQGLTRDELEAHHADELAAWRAGTLDAPTGGETTTQILDRFDAALATAHRASPPGVLLVVTHGGIARAVARRAGLEVPRVLANCETLWLHFDGDALTARVEVDALSGPGANVAEAIE